MTMNDLTKRLFAEGYTPDNHPDYVRWDSGSKEFSYTHQHKTRMVWQAPCGAFKKGGNENGWGSYSGVDYRTENNNPRFGCPYPKRPCEHRDDERFWAGENCVFYESAEPYDYENSLEKADDEDDKAQSAAWEKLRSEIPGVSWCANVRWNRLEKTLCKQFFVENCVSYCVNSVCAITRQPLDHTQVYIEYDVLRTWRTRRGLIEETRREVTKGLRVFRNSCGKTIAELWIKKYQQGEIILRPKLNREERQYIAHAKRQREHPEIFGGAPFYPGYDEYEFSATVQNVRTKPKGKNARDLARDLADVAEGITVVHESDRAKAAAQAKRERKETRLQQRLRRLERLILEKGFDGLADIDQHRAQKKLGGEGIRAIERRRTTERTQAPPTEQLSLFEPPRKEDAP
jgi:hypothetical protein